MHSDRTRRGRTERPLPLHRRITHRREGLKLTAYQLAERVGISPSYVSMIETGKKVPAEDVAMRIAQVLGDDPELYGAWAHDAREDLRSTLTHLNRASRYRDSQELQNRLARGDDVDTWEEFDQPFPLSTDSSSTPSANAAAAGHPDFISIPVLEDGADPGPDPVASDHVVEVLQLHARMLPDRPERPFAYRPAVTMVRRVHPLIHAGDLVILDAARTRISPETVQAVRFRGAITLSRVVVKGHALLLLPAGDSSDFDVVDLDGPDALDLLLAGTVVVTIRNWTTRNLRRPPEEQPILAIEQSVSARPARQVLPLGFRTPTTKPRRDRWKLTDDRFLERDCKWRRKYGWRPNQRPEDMDFLADHPGSRIRFRLLPPRAAKEDENPDPQYYLEMTLAEWRAALGEYCTRPNWERHGYIVAITRRRNGKYTEEFQRRWARYVRTPDSPPRTTSTP